MGGATALSRGRRRRRASTASAIFSSDDPAYFDRDGLYGGRSGDYPDNAERYSEFCRAAIEIAKTCLARRRDPLSRLADRAGARAAANRLRRRSAWRKICRSSSPFTIWAITGYFAATPWTRAGIPVGAFHPGGIEFYGSVNFLKGGLVFSDYLTTVSRKYAQEIQTREFGYGLDGVVRGRADRLVGILNGVDYTAWNPGKRQVDRREVFRERFERQASLQAGAAGIIRTCRTTIWRPTPVIGIVSRFADQKGFDLIAERAHELMHEDLLLVVLGTGDRKI